MILSVNINYFFKQEVLERTNLPTFHTLFKSKLSFGKSQFYYIFIFHSITAKVKQFTKKLHCTKLQNSTQSGSAFVPT
jgi:hypothetical protein